MYPGFQKEKKQTVNGPITIREICTAIEKIKTEKVPGPDRLSRSY